MGISVSTWRMTCSCCGSCTRGRQWNNRDHGFGLCRKCGLWLVKDRGVSCEEMRDLYGIKGVHYDIEGEDC